LRLRLSKRAAQQIEDALDYVATRSPKGAVAIRDRLRELTGLLEGHPYAGQQTDRPGVRRLPTNPYPYCIDYRVLRDEVVVMRFRHAKRRPSGT
jgi:plasmid stabilization system protein ParE